MGLACRARQRAQPAKRRPLRGIWLPGCQEHGRNLSLTRCAAWQSKAATSLFGEERTVPEGLTPADHWDWAVALDCYPLDMQPALPEGPQGATPRTRSAGTTPTWTAGLNYLRTLVLATT